MSSLATSQHIKSKRMEMRKIMSRGRGITAAPGADMSVARAAANRGDADMDSARANLGDVQKFFVEQGMNLPSRELAARFQVFMRGRNPISTNTMLDEAVKAAIAHPNNVDQQILAVIHMGRTGSIPAAVAGSVVEWMTLMRSGSFDK